jgi:hypothetical protein
MSKMRRLDSDSAQMGHSQYKQEPRDKRILACSDPGRPMTLRAPAKRFADYGIAMPVGETARSADQAGQTRGVGRIDLRREGAGSRRRSQAGASASLQHRKR